MENHPTIALMKFVPFLGYHHILMIFLMIGIALQLLAINTAGCTTSNNLPNVYILSLSYPSSATKPPPSTTQLNPNISTTFSTIASTHSQLEVRVSYLGICISQVTSQWLCAHNALTLSNLLKLYGGPGSGEHDPLNLIWVGGRFKDAVLFPGLLLTAIPLAFLGILFLATFPGWHEEEDADGEEREVKPFPSRPISYLAIAVMLAASLFSVISIFVQHVAGATGSAMVEALSYGTAKAKVGTAAMILGWVGACTYAVAAAGLWIMIRTIEVLSIRSQMDRSNSPESEPLQE